jgi:hypothetical protein
MGNASGSVGLMVCERRILYIKKRLKCTRSNMKSVLKEQDLKSMLI